AKVQQFVPRLDRKGKGIEYLPVLLGMQELFLDHKAAPDGIIGLSERTAIDQSGMELHPIGVEGQEFFFELNVPVNNKGDLPLPGKLQPFMFPYPVNTSRNAVNGHPYRIGPQKPHHHGNVRGMSFAGQGQRSIEQHLDGCHLLEFSLFPEFPDPTLRGTPRPKGVGAGGPHPDLEHIKDTYTFHTVDFCPSKIVSYSLIRAMITKGGTPNFRLPRKTADLPSRPKWSILADSLSDSWPWHNPCPFMGRKKK